MAESEISFSEEGFQIDFGDSGTDLTPEEQEECDFLRSENEKKDTDKYYQAGFSGFYPGKRNGTGRGRSIFHVNNKWAKSRRAVDKNTTGAKLLEIFGPHASEAGWNLPRNHDRHLLNFPIDILMRILSCCLTTPFEVTPTTVTCNCMYDFTEPSYSIGLTGSDRYWRQTVLCQVEGVDYHHKIHNTHNKGRKKYCTKEYYGYFRKPIDATILRVSKLLYQTGLPILLGENSFVFDIDTYETPTRPHKQMKDFRMGPVERDREMPHDMNAEEVQHEIRDLVNIQDCEDLPDWIFCDPFARFIYSIGPKNASMIRQLRFVGPLLPPNQPYWGRMGSKLHNTCPSIGPYFKAYIPFILRYCQNLVKLGLGFSAFFQNNSEEREKLYAVDPEDRANQPGDHLLSADILELAKLSREENRKKKIGAAILDFENTIALHLKPDIDSLVPNLKKLQVLEVKRAPVGVYPDPPPLVHTFNKFIDTVTWLDMKIAEDAKRALAIAVFKRSKEMEEAAEKLAALARRDRQNEIPASSTSGRGRGRGHGPSTPQGSMNSSGNRRRPYSSWRGRGGARRGNKGRGGFGDSQEELRESSRDNRCLVGGSSPITEGPHQSILRGEAKSFIPGTSQFFPGSESSGHTEEFV